MADLCRLLATAKSSGGPALSVYEGPNAMNDKQFHLVIRKHKLYADAGNYTAVGTITTKKEAREFAAAILEAVGSEVEEED